ncbi:MAG: redoxin domain-containing protein [Lachnospiraceae bacterium]|nr:redoxin domain-containing protein [Lachnospiraceae bacterium]
MALTATDSIPVITVLIQGFLSFFSPCVLPLLPLYIGYLSGGAGGVPETSRPGKEAPGESGQAQDTPVYSKRRVLVNTLCFVIGISFSFFLLGLGMRAVGRFFSGNQLLFSRIGGILIVLFGLYQLGIFGASSFLMKERRLPVNPASMAMSPLTALLMGFVFSFAWTPCVGPTLSGVLLMAASAKSSAAGFALVGVYTLGFVLPFLLTGLFTTSVLDFFRRHRGVVRYTVRISGVLLILMGLLMITGQMNSITGYLSRISGGDEPAAAAAEHPADAQSGAAEPEENASSADHQGNPQPESPEAAPDAGPAQGEASGAAHGDAEGETPDSTYDKVLAPDFTLTDQYGTTHTLSEYRGKLVFLNFWATWCPPCRAEMPDIQALYEENEAAEDSDLVILAVAFPTQSGETTEEGVKSFLEENGYTYPTLMDSAASLAEQYYITAFPTTYMIDPEGYIYGYVPGSMSKEIMEDIIRQTREGTK